MSKDKRFFKRYPAEKDTLLFLDDKPVRAKIIDYSLQGVGAFIYDMPSHLEGAIVRGDTDNPIINCSGKIIR
ncbi:MAG: PilZ domain-containing protein [Planctomycetota bacterium]